MIKNNPRFDIVRAAAEGYRQLWQERRVFIHLSILPMTIKIATFVVIMSLQLEENYLRQGLLLLPSFFLEGWLVAVAICYSRRHITPPPDGVFSSRETLSCMILYVLAKMVATFVSSFMLMHRVPAAGQLTSEQVIQDPGLFPLAFIILALAVWGFRLLWLYVPAAMGYRLEDYLKKTNRFIFSFYLMGFWILCFVPPALALVMVAKIFPHAGEGVFVPYMIILSVVQAFIELCIIIVSALGFSYAVQGIMHEEGRWGRPPS